MSQGRIQICGRLLGESVPPRTRIQLCGRLVAEIEGRRVEDDLPGRKGRLLFAYLVVNRDRNVTRDELVEAIWPERTPSAVDGDLRSLVSKVRRAVGREALGLRSRFRLELPADTWIDVEKAMRAVHEAEAAVAVRHWARAWSTSLTALLNAQREFLSGEEASWIDQWRRVLEDTETRALECYAAASIGIGVTELFAAERAARRLVERQPYRESGYRLLMEALAAEGNIAEAMHVYDELCRLLREELAIAPSPSTQEVHKRLLHVDIAHAER